MGNVDTCLWEGEEAEGTNNCLVWLIIFAQCSANSWILGWVFWRAKYLIVPDGPMSSFLVTRIIGGVVRRFLCSWMYRNILALHRCSWKTPIAAKPTERWCGTEDNYMVWDGGSTPFVVPKRWDLLRVTLGWAPERLWGEGVYFTKGSVWRHLRVTYEIYLMIHTWYEMAGMSIWRFLMDFFQFFTLEVFKVTKSYQTLLVQPRMCIKK